jgi:hypothetical protein
MLFRFDEVENSPTFGAVAINLDGDDFEPGKHLPLVSLEFWADAGARGIVHSGDHFIVWYSKDIGEGRIKSVFP